MKAEAKGWPTNNELYTHNHFDSRRWRAVSLRPGDVIVSPYAKCGTTREQRTLLELLGSGSDTNVTDHSPYIELCLEPIENVVARLEEQEGRRVIKGHLPLDHLPYREDVSYIDVWRSPFDVAVSLHHHHTAANEEYFRLVNGSRPAGTPIFYPNKLSARDWIIRWFEEDGFPYWPYWRHIRSSWEYRHLENVSIFHFSDVLSDHEGEVRKRALFLGVNLTPELLARTLKRSSFIHMKKEAHKNAPAGGAIWGKGGGKEFFRRGQNGDWREILSNDDIRHCQNIIKRQLEPDAISYLVR